MQSSDIENEIKIEIPNSEGLEERITWGNNPEKKRKQFIKTDEEANVNHNAVINIELNKILIAKLIKIIQFKERLGQEVGDYIKWFDLLELGCNLFPPSIRRINNAFEIFINNPLLMNDNFFDPKEI